MGDGHQLKCLDSFLAMGTLELVHTCLYHQTGALELAHTCLYHQTRVTASTHCEPGPVPGAITK